MTEPIRPRPEDFGLTEERLAELRKGSGLRPFWTVIIPMFFAAVVVSFLMVSSPGYAVFLGLCLTVFPGFFIASHLIVPLEQRWRDEQPDSAAWAQYGRATLDYEKAHADWLKTQQSWWSSLEPSDFEVQVANNLKARGYAVERTGRTGDGGVDIRATAPGGTRIVVQCKAYREPVGPGAIRELYGTLIHDGAQEGWLVSLAGFSSAAQQFADGKPLRLLAIDTLIQHSGEFRRVEVATSRSSDPAPPPQESIVAPAHQELSVDRINTITQVTAGHIARVKDLVGYGREVDLPYPKELIERAFLKGIIICDDEEHRQNLINTYSMLDDIMLSDGEYVTMVEFHGLLAKGRDKEWRSRTSPQEMATLFTGSGFSRAVAVQEMLVARMKDRIVRVEEMLSGETVSQLIRAGSATSACPQRTIVFPANRSMGTLSWLSKSELREGLERWKPLGEARGVVNVAADSAVRLDVNLDARDDPSPLGLLGADDLQWLGFTAWRSPSSGTDHGLAYIEHMTGLEGLDLAGTHVTDSGLAHIAGLSGLRVLLIEGNPLTDAGLVHLARLTKLETLDLWGDRVEITDTGLAHLAKLTSLQYLTLWGAPITDAGLIYLRRLTALRRLGVTLSSSKVTRAGLEALQRVLPKLESVG